MQKLYTWLTRQDGQTMAEYGVVLSVIAIGGPRRARPALGRHRQRDHLRRRLHRVALAQLRRGSGVVPGPRLSLLRPEPALNHGEAQITSNSTFLPPGVAT
jgi:hypothetical protein